MILEKGETIEWASVEKGDHFGGFMIVQMQDDQSLDQRIDSRDGENRMDSMLAGRRRDRRKSRGCPDFCHGQLD